MYCRSTFNFTQEWQHLARSSSDGIWIWFWIRQNMDLVKEMKLLVAAQLLHKLS